jgi:hypothetical protein
VLGFLVIAAILFWIAIFRRRIWGCIIGGSAKETKEQDLEDPPAKQDLSSEK